MRHSTANPKHPFGSYLERAAQQPAKLAREDSAKPCGRMKLRKPLGIVSLIGASNRRSRSVTTVFGVLPEPICYGSVWGTARADLLRHALLGVLQERICYGIVWYTAEGLRELNQPSGREFVPPIWAQRAESFSRPLEGSLFYLYDGLRELKASPGHWKGVCSTYMKGSQR